MPAFSVGLGSASSGGMRRQLAFALSLITAACSMTSVDERPGGPITRSESAVVARADADTEMVDTETAEVTSEATFPTTGAEAATETPEAAAPAETEAETMRASDWIDIVATLKNPGGDCVANVSFNRWQFEGAKETSAAATWTQEDRVEVAYAVCEATIAAKAVEAAAEDLESAVTAGQGLTAAQTAVQADLQKWFGQPLDLERTTEVFSETRDRLQTAQTFGRVGFADDPTTDLAIVGTLGGNTVINLNLPAFRKLDKQKKVTTLFHEFSHAIQHKTDDNGLLRRLTDAVPFYVDLTDPAKTKQIVLTPAQLVNNAYTYEGALVRYLRPTLSSYIR